MEASEDCVASAVDVQTGAWLMALSGRVPETLRLFSNSGEAIRLVKALLLLQMT